MSKQSESILSKTSSSRASAAVLILEDGSVFPGYSVGVQGEAFGEICFNTSCVGYPEVISDPSYAGQIITMTYPQIGNYGINRGDLQSDNLALRGLVVHALCTTPSNWRSDLSLPHFLSENSIVAIAGVDTRSLTRHIRQKGAQRALISTIDNDPASLLAKVQASPSIVGENLAATVSCSKAYTYTTLPPSQNFARIHPDPARYKVVVYDCGVKRSILSALVRAGCEVTIVPWNTPAHEVLALSPNGVFLSNGPGDPEAVEETFSQVEKLLGKVPLFGICLGHQMLCKAAGAHIEKLKFGHRGGNQPVKNLLTGRVEITAQNHGFGLLFPSLGSLIPEYAGWHTTHEEDLRFWARNGYAPVVANKKFGRIRLTHVNLNDGSAEGIAFMDVPAFSVQYHPEASPGADDAAYLFTAFTRLMDGREDYLDIDIAKQRLAGWKFGSPEGAE